MIDNQDLILAFITESIEMLDDVEPNLVMLGKIAEETGQVDYNVINNVFRLFHSLKGGASSLQLDNIASVTHEMETLLDLFRNKQAELSSEHVSLLCRACDIVRTILTEVENSFSDAGFEKECDILKKEIISAIKSAEKNTKKPAKSSKKKKTSSKSDSSPKDTQEPPQKKSEIKITPAMIQTFCQESLETLDTVEQSLLELEEDPKNKESLNNAFRNIHSFKGNCGFFSLKELETLSHTTETLLDKIRAGIIPFDNKEIMILLAVVDKLREGIHDFSNSGTGNIEGYEQILEFISQTMSENPSLPTEESTENLPENISEEESIEQDNKIDRILTDASSQSASFKRKDIRIDITKVDNLINLIGELVIAEAMVTKNPDLEGQDFENFEKAAQHLNKIIRELHDSAMGMRMIPISGLFRKMLRLVYDLSSKCGKRVDLRISGEDTEIDRSVVENLSDPLVHIIRNAVDHGIENPEERIAAGKPETGIVKLEAKHEGGEVWITIQDDGKGLDRDKIAKKAQDLGFIGDDISTVSDSEIFKVIFLPGFSTAQEVTDLSGRGVGMDVVRQNIEKLKGRIDISSQKGEGSTFVLRFPLTLAIIDGMLVKVGKSCFIIPLLSIKESLQITDDQIARTMDKKELINIRGKLISVLRLHEMYNITPDHTDLHDGILVVVEDRGETIALFVDRLLGQQQIVLKALDSYLGNIRGVSGCSILGNGEVSLILDIGGLIRASEGEK